MSVSIKIRPLATALAVATVLACGMTATNKSAFGEEGNKNEATRADTSGCIVGSSTFASCFPDYNLAVQVAESTEPDAKTPEDIMTQADVDGLTDLRAEGVSNLAGIENLTALTKLSISIGGITDLAPLDNHVLAQNITELELDENEITDISPLRNYTNAWYIDLTCNHISDLSPLKDLHPHTLKVSDQHIYLGRQDLRGNPNQAVSMPIPIGKDGEPVTPFDIEPADGLKQTNTDLTWSAPAAGGPRSFHFDNGEDQDHHFEGSVQLEVVTAEPRLVTFTPLQPVDPQPTTGQRVAHGLSATKPADPVCPGYRFVGWYTSPRVGGERFNFEKPIVENTPLYGRWVSNTDDSGNSQDESSNGPGAGDNQTPLPELEKVACEPGTSTYTQCFPDENLAKQLASRAWKSPEAILTQDDIDREFADGIVLSDVWNLNGIQILKNIKTIILDYDYSHSQDQSPVDLRPLSELTEITSFQMTGTADKNAPTFPLVTDFTPLSKLVKMETITINTAGLENVNGFESFTGMTKLKDIDLSNNRISDVRSLSALSSLHALSGIDLRKNGILDASPLKPFEQSPAYISISDQVIIVGRHELPDTTLALSLPIRPDGKYVFNEDDNIHSISDKGRHNPSSYEVVWDVPVQDTVHSYEFWDEGYQEGSWSFEGIVTDRPIDDVSGRDIYQIHFDLGTAPTLSRIPDQLVYSGNLASKVPDPIRYKHDFDGWYMKETPATPDETPANSDDTLTRNLSGTGDILTRNLLGSDDTADDGSTDTSTTVGDGSADSGTTAKEVLFDFASTRVNKDIALTARWTPRYTLTFDSQGGSAVPSQSVRADQTPKEPAAPTRTGYTFQGWSTAAQNGTPVDFTQLIGQDTTVYAQWTPGTAPVTPVVPDTPATPSTPVNPDTPATPDTPVNPGASATPDTPVNPGTPPTPDNPLVSGNSTSQISTDSPVSRMTTGKYVTTSRGSRLGTLASTGSDLLGLMFAALVIVLCGLGCQAHLRSRRSSVPR